MLWIIRINLWISSRSARFVICILHFLGNTISVQLVIFLFHLLKLNFPIHKFLSLLDCESSQEKIEECYKLILELSDNNTHQQYQPNKRKYQCIPASPNGVMDVNFSRDNSNDSWAVASVSFSPEPLFKRSRSQDQQMRLAPINRVSVGLLCNPH